MKVKQLIDKLSSLDPDMDVYIQGYEDGLEDLENIGLYGVIRDLNDTKSFWWVGAHEYDSGGKTSLVITRNNSAQDDE